VAGENGRKSALVKVLGSAGVGGVLIALGGFLGRHEWEQFVEARKLAVENAGHVSALQEKMADHVEREEKAQWRVLAKNEERLTELHVRVRVLEELVDRLTDARAKSAQAEAAPPPKLPDEVMDEVRRINSMREKPDEFRANQMMQQDVWRKGK
jgi:hypothetical protein